MASSKTQPARGMRDFLPADVRRREYVIGVIKEVYERYGFEPLETPAVENIETLMGKYGEEGNQLIFKILKRGEHEKTGEADLALRYDLTVPLARVVAQYQNELPKFFKRYQIQPVWRADRPARGRFREFYQCDVDILGSRSMVVEAELIAAVSDVLTRLGFNDFIIRLNHRQILTGWLNAFGVPTDQHDSALIALDKLDKIGPDGVQQELTKRAIRSDIRLIPSLIDISSAGKAISNLVAGGTETRANLNIALAALGRVLGDDQIGVSELRSIVNFAAAAGCVENIQIDPRLARGLSYYTGAIMEISVGKEIGSLGGGGRYDNLIGMFSGREVPACGFSLGLERIIVVMTERGMFPPDLVSSPADVMVTIWDENSIGVSLALARELRSSGLRVDLYPEAVKLGKEFVKVGKQFKYASSRGIPFVAILGEEERAWGQVSIKDLRSGEQRGVKRGEVATVIRAALDHTQPAGEAGDSIEPGVERSGTPGIDSNSE